MKHRFICILIFAFYFSSCKKEDVPLAPNQAAIDSISVQNTINLNVDGLSRSFIVYLPKGNNNAGKLPLIFVLHGQGGTDNGMIQIADFRPLADSEKILLIYPQALNNVWNDGRPVQSNQQGINDVNFINYLIGYAATNYNADTTRVYSTGLSSGGFMSSRLGSELSNKIAAIASVAATIESNNIYPNFNPSRKVSALYIHGTTDPLVPFNGGAVGGSGIAFGYCVSHQQAIDKWVSVNSCNSNPVKYFLPDITPDGTSVKQSIYSGGVDNSEVVSYVITNGGHTWPQGYQYLPEGIIGKTCLDINACNIIWNFFQRFKRL